ncbi:DUF1285 domain-containing protein [Psychrobacter sp. AH5]|uniref:DUF1285 domain-containing protein n=1 Tax=Psychrobacter sp. AH5 TaxID=2937433 RepID=UPI0033418F1A
MDNNHKADDKNSINSAEVTADIPNDLKDMEALSHYIKSVAGVRQARSIPPLDQWQPEQTIDMDLVIKANGEWWHEGTHMTRESLVSLFATILWKEEINGKVEYFLKTPVQKLRIKVEDAPLLINDVGIVTEDAVSWLEFSTSTGDIVRLDQQHQLELRPFYTNDTTESSATPQVRPYMLVRNGLEALVGRNTFYHLTQIGKLTAEQGVTTLTLHSGGQDYELFMPDEG